MSANALLREVDQLKNVSERLDVLADQHPTVASALLAIAGNVRNSAVVLEVLISTHYKHELQ